MAILGEFLRIQDFLNICISNNIHPPLLLAALTTLKSLPNERLWGRTVLQHLVAESWKFYRLQVVNLISTLCNWSEKPLLVFQIINHLVFLVNFSEKLWSDLIDNLLVITICVYVYTCVCASKMHICCTDVQKFPFIIISRYYSIWFWFYPAALICPFQRGISSLCEKDS